MRHKTETTTFRTSEGTPDRSMIVTGLPATGIRNSRERILTMLSWIEMPPNMNAKRESADSTSRRLLSQRYGVRLSGLSSRPMTSSISRLRSVRR